MQCRVLLLGSIEQDRQVGKWYRPTGTVHESRVTSVQKRMEPRRYLPGASVDVTDARYGQVLNEKQPTANQCDGLFFFLVGATGHP